MSRTQTTALLFRARDGSDEALNGLFERYAPRLLSLIRLRLGRKLRSRVESRDVLNTVLLKAFERIDQLEASDGRSLMAWLASIAENEIRDQAEFHGRQRRDAARAVPLAPGSEQLAARLRSQTSRLVLREQLERLERGLEQLDEPHREVILLRKFEELSFNEIGRRMDRKPDACRMLLVRAMTALTLQLRGER